MKNRKWLVAIAAGLIVGQIFAEGGRPFSIINTLRFGYDDNYSRTGNNGSGAVYMEDSVNFAFHASLSDRTDLMFKSQVNFRTDRDSDVYPNLYAVLSHSVSPRVLMQVSEQFMSRDRTTSSSGGRQNYLQNNLGLTTTYIVNEKNRLSASVNHGFQKSDGSDKILDYTQVGAGISWARDIHPQRTQATLSMNYGKTEYDNRNSSYDSTDVSLGLNHTFNQNWQASVMGGLTYLNPDFGPAADSSSDMAPLFSLAATYAPTPRTRFTGSVSQKYGVSSHSSFGAENSQTYSFDVQHDLTAKIMVKGTVRFVDSQYDAGDNEAGGGKSDQERLDLSAELRYKINRLNFLELRLQHSDRTFGDGESIDQNRIDLGWRVEI